MNDDIFNKLRDFVVEHAEVEEEEVLPDARIEDDLRVTGDNAVDFLIAYSKTFNVDVSKFIITDYFDAEGDPILPPILWKVTGKKKKVNQFLIVAHLEKGIRAGRLDEEVING